MCMEDIRIGRKSRTNERAINYVGGASQQLLGPDAKRIGIVFCCSNVMGHYTVSTAQDQAANQGLYIGATPGSYPINLDDLGDAITKPWFVYSTLSGLITVFEIFLDDQ